MKIFAERLKYLRLEKELSQRELAEKLGLSHSVVAHWENELRAPSAEAIVLLAKYFNVSADYLLGLTDD